jgi:hypothetical protein
LAHQLIFIVYKTNADEISERFTRLVTSEEKKRKEQSRQSKSPIYSLPQFYHDSSPVCNFDVSLDDFGPPLSSYSPDRNNTGYHSMASTPTDKSFARIAMNSFQSQSLPNSWKKTEFVHENNWTLDISTDMLESVIQSPESQNGSKGKKKGKKILLFGTGGTRGRN